MTRFELKLREDRRAALDSLADEAGISASDLVRLAINRLLDDRASLLRGSSGQRHEAAA